MKQFVIKYVTNAAEVLPKLKQVTAAIREGAVATTKGTKVLSKNVKMQGREVTMMKKQKALVQKTTTALKGENAVITKGNNLSVSKLGNMAKKIAVYYALYRVIRLVTAALKSQVDAVVQLDDAMGRIKTVTHVTADKMTDSLRAIRREIVEYSKTSRESLEDIAQVPHYLGTAGRSIAEQVAGIKPIMDLFTGTKKSGSSIEQTARTMTAIMNNLGQSITGVSNEHEKLQKIADMVAYTFSKEDVEMSELSNSLKYVTGRAAIANVKFSDLIGTLGFLGTHMERGSRAGTSFNRVLLAMVKNKGKIEKLLGMEFDPKSSLDMIKVLEAVARKIGDMTPSSIQAQEALKDLFDIRGMRTGAPLVKFVDEWIEDLKKVETHSKGFAEKLKGARMDTMVGQGKRVANAWRALGVELGIALDISSDLKTVFREMTNFLNEMILPVSIVAVTVDTALTNLTTLMLKAAGVLAKVKRGLSAYEESQKPSKFSLFNPFKPAHSGLKTTSEQSKKAKETLSEANKELNEFIETVDSMEVKPFGKAYVEYDDRRGKLKEEFLAKLKEEKKIRDALLNQQQQESVLAKERTDLLNKQLSIINQMEQTTGKMLADIIRYGGKGKEIITSLGDIVFENTIQSMVNKISTSTGIFQSSAQVAGTALGTTASDIIKTQATVSGQAYGQAAAQEIAMVTGGAAQGGSGKLGGLKAAGGIADVLKKSVLGGTSWTKGYDPKSKAAQQPGAYVMGKYIGKDQTKQGMGLGDLVGGIKAMVPMALMGMSVMQGMKSQHSQTHAYDTAPGSEEWAGKVQTRMTTKAKITNIVIKNTFNGIPSGETKVVADIADKISTAAKEQMAAFFERENIAVGNV